MPNTGQDLGVDIYGLWRAGRNDLPAVAAQFAVARSAVENTADWESAFRRSEHFGGGTHGQAHGPWTALRDEVARILQETETNLELTGDALCLAAREYAKTDQAAAAEFDRLKLTNVDVPSSSGFGR